MDHDHNELSETSPIMIANTLPKKTEDKTADFYLIAIAVQIDE